MAIRLSKLLAAAGLMAAVWGVNAFRQPDNRVWVRAGGAAQGRVRIVRFFGSAGPLARGQKASLCYDVENARSVRISPMMQQLSPSTSHCVEVEPTHTTHYTLVAEGFDGQFATESITVSVEADAPPPPRPVQYAVAGRSRATYSATGSLAISRS
jgi:hypothetical protein